MANAEQNQRTVLWLGQAEQELSKALADSDWEVREVPIDRTAEAVLGRNTARVGLLDLRGSQGEKLPALTALVGAYPDKRWIVLACPRSLANAEVSSLIRISCFDYVTAPINAGRLVAVLGRAWGMAQLKPPAADPQADAVEDMLGDSAPMRMLARHIGKFAPVDVPVLITGETGTGKEVAARALHRKSARHARPFVAINCGALVPNLVQSELFGHERGAFTGANARKIGHIEAAAGGTAFLDEIGDLPLDAQTSLLRFLQEGTIERLGSCESLRPNVRVVAATHVDLEKAVREGRFREDLYYRLNVLRLPVPPLRERGADILHLAEHFLDVFRRQHAIGAQVRGLGPDAQAALCAFAWPGNVRELMNRVRRAAVVAESPMIRAVDLDLPAAASGDTGEPSETGSLDRARERAERNAIVTSLRASRFNVSECARRLQVSRVTVYRLCKKYSVALDDVQAH